MIINRYLSREIMNALFAITIVLLLALMSQQIVRYMGFVATGKIPSKVLIKLLSLEVPHLLSILLPLGLYLGILLAYGRLYADNEMAILQMCGFGSGKLMRVILFITFIIAGIVFYLMMFINPIIIAERQEIMNNNGQTLHLIQSLIPGRFQASPDGRHVMFVEKLSRDRLRAENVFIADEKKVPEDADQNTWKVVFAKQGYQVKDTQSNDDFFVTADGYRYEGTPGQNDFKIIQYHKYAVRIPQNEARAKQHEVETMSLQQLMNHYTNPQFAAELQWRISIPLSAILLAMLAVPLSTVRPRQGRYLMFVPAALIYIIYFNLLFIARHWIDDGVVQASIGMWWVHAAIMFFVLLALVISNMQRK